MSQTSQLYTLAPNVPNRITVTGQANRVRVVNDSSLYCRIYFGADAPRLATDPGWHDTISPGDKPLLWITGGTGQSWWAQTGNAASTPFTGVIVILPFFPVGTTVPSGGVVTGASILYVTAFSPDENADRGGQTEAFVQAAKQGRVQAIEGGVFRSIATLLNTHANNVFLGTQVQLLSATMPNLFDRNAQAVSSVNAYVYSCMLNVMNYGPLMGTFDGFLALDIRDSTLAVVRVSVEFFRYQFIVAPDTWPAAQQQIVIPLFQGNTPLFVQLGLAQNQLVNGDVVVMSHHITTNTGTWQNHINASFMIDTVNQTPLLTFPFPSNPAWATNNPQTY